MRRQIRLTLLICFSLAIATFAAVSASLGAPGDSLSICRTNDTNVFLLWMSENLFSGINGKKSVYWVPVETPSIIPKPSTCVTLPGVYFLSTLTRLHVNVFEAKFVHQIARYFSPNSEILALNVNSSLSNGDLVLHNVALGAWLSAGPNFSDQQSVVDLSDPATKDQILPVMIEPEHNHLNLNFLSTYLIQPLGWIQYSDHRYWLATWSYENGSVGAECFEKNGFICGNPAPLPPQKEKEFQLAKGIEAFKKTCRPQLANEFPGEFKDPTHSFCLTQELENLVESCSSLSSISSIIKRLPPGSAPLSMAAKASDCLERGYPDHFAKLWVDVVRQRVLFHHFLNDRFKSK
jgi:hypothetical protein